MGIARGEFVDELIEVLGEDRAIDLAEAFGGTRLYVANSVTANRRIVKAMGQDIAVALMEGFAPSVIKVPLLRERRAARYRNEGLSNGQIATRLVMTESGIERMFRRLAEDQPS